MSLPGLSKLVVATHNRGKLSEIRGLLEPFGIESLGAGELGLPEPEENGISFEENAFIKAMSAAKASGLPCLSDDSGLCVDALGGAPGLHTADWAEKPDGAGRDWNMAMRKVEDALRERNAIRPDQRTGRFVCVLCLSFPDGRAEYFRGEAEGKLVWPPRGDMGFGFDPVFVPEGHERSFAEMTPEEKHGWEPGESGLSHRARAFALFHAALLERDGAIAS